MQSSQDSNNHSTHSLLDDNHSSGDMMETAVPSVGMAAQESPTAAVAAASSTPATVASLACNFSYFSSLDFRELLGWLGVVLVCSLSTLLAIEPHQRPIPFQLLESTGEYVRNLTNNEEYLDQETVPDILLILLVMVAPVLIQLGLSKTKWGRYGDAHAALCVYVAAFSIVLSTTAALKLYVGYLRPIFYDGCEPSEAYSFCTAEDAGGSSIRMSFPSGHASSSFCGLTLLSMYLHLRFGVPSVRVYHRQETTAQEGLYRWTPAYTKGPALYRALSVLSLSPLVLALFIAASRVVDNKHFPADAVGGALLGASIAVFTHGLWYS